MEQLTIYLPYLIPSVAAIPLAIGVRLIFAPLKPTKADPRMLSREARTLETQGDHSSAADIHLQLGNLGRAVELYITARAFKPAADILIRQQRSRDAASLLIRAQDFAGAARLMDKAGENQTAADYYIKAGDNLRAAESIEKLGDFAKAAQHFEAAEDFRKAAEMYSQAREYRHAGRMMELCYADERGRLSGVAGTRAMSNLAYWAAGFYRAAREYLKAAELFKAENFMREAAASYESAGDFEKAAEAFTVAGDMLKAAETLEKSGEGDKSSVMKAETLVKQGKKDEAADFYASAGNLPRAAQLKEEAGNFRQAARYYIEAGNPQKAAEMLEKSGDFVRAAEFYEEASDFTKAAALYKQAGEDELAANSLARNKRFFEAGKGFFGLGQIDRALELLQNIEQRDPDYKTGLILMGEIFVKKNLISNALEKLEEAIGGEPVKKELLEPYYHLSMVYEKTNKRQQALKILEKIIGINYNFRDSAERMESLRAELAMATTEPDRPEQDFRAVTSSPPSPIIYSETAAPPAAPPAALSDPNLNTENRYEILEKIGQGGSGSVYMARDTFLDRIVAYKVLTSGGAARGQELDNFRREAKAAASLSHQNIVTVYDSGINNGQYFITMEYIDGPNLRQLVEEHGQMPFSAILLMMGQTCKALAHAHEHMIVHRDIKNSNILFKDKKVIKIVDFGLAKFLQDLRNLQTVWGGTPYYMSPEQILGEQIDHRTDIYSFGISLFELTTGLVPFREGDVGYHHVHSPAPDPRELRPDTPDKLAEIVVGCLKKEPTERYQSMEQIFQDLRQLKSS